MEIAEAIKAKLLDLNIAKTKDFGDKNRQGNKSITKRGGRRKIAIVFKNCGGMQKLFKTSESNILAKHSLVYLSEKFMLSSRASNPWANRKEMHIVSAENNKGKKGGRKIRGQATFIEKSLNASLFSSTKHHQCTRIKDVFIVGIYLQDGMELDDKILIVTKLLDEIYRECTSAKVILAGDLKLNPKKKMKIE